MVRKPKTVFQLETPFTAIQWPEITPEHQDTMLELLCNLVSPIGQHRSHHIQPSSGNRNKKRKRRKAKLIGVIEDKPKAPLPEISSFIVVGLNNITRALECSSQRNQGRLYSAQPGVAPGGADSDADSHIQSQFVAIFVLRSQPSILHAHIPQIIATASSAPRLVQFAKGSDSRLCAALGLQRVSFIGLLEGAPHSESLVNLVREVVPEIKAAWLNNAKNAAYLPVKINAIDTFTGPEDTDQTTKFQSN
ncbi:hypothetical protein B7494_g772 [Chlorociboria aeruginascens]|nr:hypothetical protein B7494_g772 [Chlorociboria aeruginascens]